MITVARLWASLGSILLLVSIGPATAQPPASQLATPSLTARIAGVDTPENRSRKLRIARFEATVRIHGAVAETSMEIRFENGGSEQLEGDFTMAMPAGSVVTGYALDVNGQMVDGVLVDQRQARLAYEARVRERIDPGLVEVSRDNLFRTRIFPIFPRNGRTIRLRFASPLDPRTGYVLPLRKTEEIGALSLTVEASGIGSPPAVRLPSGLDAGWTRAAQGPRLNVSDRNVGLDGDLVIAPAQPAGRMLVSRHSNGRHFFQIADAAPASSRSAEPERRIAILWDRSLSRADDELETELQLLDRYLQRADPEEVELVLFDSGPTERVRVSSGAEALRRLRAVRYRGATSYAGLARERLDGFDACFLFSDGLVTIDPRDGFRPACPLTAVSSAADADRASLAALARQSGGEVHDLTTRSADQVLTRLTSRVPRVTSVRSSGGQPIDFTLFDGGETGWRIVGPMPASGDLVVRFSGLRGERERVYRQEGDAVSADGAGALWAAERAALLAARDDRDREALLALSRSYSVASPDVSFVVLETGRDYALARFDPPATLPAALLDEYRRVREDMKEQETRARGQRLSAVLTQWEEMRGWWSRRHDPSRARKPDQRGRAQTRPAVPTVAPPPLVAPPSPAAPPPPEEEGEAVGEQVVVTGSRIGNPQLDSAAPLSVQPADAAAPGAAAGRVRLEPRGTITLEPWAPDRPYLAALDAARPADFERVFEEQRRQHGALPAFWLDVADWAFRKNRRVEAVQLVLSALELPTRNNQTLSIVADRLMRYGEPDRAIWLYERLLAGEDDRPQPRRTLALALAKRAETAPHEQARADLARALSLLTEVVMTPWNGAYDGIEMISLVEANRLIPRYRARGGGEIGLDPRLIALMDADMRVLVEWNTEATDIDLWVDEATGERAIFHNPRTAAGGRLSNDMTQGFGPEEYLLRNAPTGAYEVRANVFAPDRIDPNGAQRVTARIIRDFGRPNEREEVIDIELLPTDQTRERRIATVRFGT